MKQQVKYEVMHLLKMANITNDDIADRIAERICLIAEEYYKKKDDSARKEEDARTVKSGRWHEKLVRKWFDNESKF